VWTLTGTVILVVDQMFFPVFPQCLDIRLWYMDQMVKFTLQIAMLVLIISISISIAIAIFNNEQHNNDKFFCVLKLLILWKIIINIEL
jgi:ABC-type phosphate/phosphonate transport system permease subunit